MTRKLFELVGADPDRPFSPYVWRTRLALAHKGLAAERIPWRFTEKNAIAPYQSEKVPVLLDGDKSVADSLAIAFHLEDAYPDRPSLFGGAGGRDTIRFINSWTDITVCAGITPLIVSDIVKLLGPTDAAYFRQSRETRFGKTLEQVTENRDMNVEGFRKTLEPLRLTLRSQPFLGGTALNYADTIVFGPFQWARVTSPFRLLKEDDPIYAWRERMLDAFDGMARQSKAFPV